MSAHLSEALALNVRVIAAAVAAATAGLAILLLVALAIRATFDPADHPLAARLVPRIVALTWPIGMARRTRTRRTC